MNSLLRWLAGAEVSVALNIATLGEWWAAHAARRLGKFSGEKAGGAE